MARVHLWEWEDLPWVPKVFRDFITDNLHFLFTAFGLFNPVAGMINDCLQRLRADQIVDLCSGGGGPLPALMDELRNDFDATPQVLLTDLYPNELAFSRLAQKTSGQVRGRIEPTSAFDAPADLGAFRTIFTGLHHFRPEGARKILEDAAQKGVGIGAFEAQERRLTTILLVPFAVFFSSLLFTPFAGRMTLSRFLFTYLIPLCPLVYAWDGFVSCLRTYSVRELADLVRDIDSPHYHWDIGQIRARGPFGFPYRITYLIGMPENHATSSGPA
ncbi:MAG: hypothetical protein SVU69_09655 [Pseudomonadota bacterium]|nr:hypothetical protein [Pseudomonadota bacterium]